MAGQLGRTCVAYKDVWSPKLGKYVSRCADFAGGYGDYGDLGDDMILEFEEGGLGKMDFLETLGLSTENLKRALTTGGVAAGGAWIGSKLTQTLTQYFPALNTKYVPELINILIGLVTGGLVSKYYKPEVGANLMVGPAVVSALSLLGLSSEVLSLASPSAATAGMLSGSNLGLLTAQRTAFTPTIEPPTRSYATGGQASIV